MSATPTNSDPKQRLAAELLHPLPPGRTWFTYGMTAIAFGLTGLALIPLLAILIEILRQGLPHLKPEVFVSLPAPAGVTDVANGFANAILGTLIMVALATLLSIPFGVMTGIFLSELGRGAAASAPVQIVASFVRFIATILSGVPSIIAGVFVCLGGDCPDDERLFSASWRVCPGNHYAADCYSNDGRSVEASP